MNYVQFVEKVCFYKKEQILYPYPPAPFPRKGGKYGDWRPCDPPWGYAQSKDALVACQKL
jgi:hypothetical protein